jgi:hypothetical protein
MAGIMNKIARKYRNIEYGEVEDIRFKRNTQQFEME